jgi:hypothetical protein
MHPAPTPGRPLANGRHDRRFTGAQRRPPRRLQWRERLRERLALRPRPLPAGSAGRRQRRRSPLARRLARGRHRAWPRQADPRACQPSRQAREHARPGTRRGAACPRPLPPVFSGHARHPPHTPALPRSRSVAPPPRQPLRHGPTRGRGAAMAPLHRTARRVCHAVRCAGGDPPALAPEPRPAGLRATDDAGVRGSANTRPGPRHLLRQDGERTCRSLACPRLRRRPEGEAEFPDLDPQGTGEISPRLRGRCLILARRCWPRHRWTPSAVVQPLGSQTVAGASHQRLLRVLSSCRGSHPGSAPLCRGHLQ